jgi:drug/metabolite transporter (DMT)-like permease
MAIAYDRVVFEERQRFRQPWLWAVLLGVCVVTGASVVTSVHSVQDSPWNGLILLPVALVCLLYRVEMRVRVDTEALSVRFSPSVGHADPAGRRGLVRAARLTPDP